jgi:hypothetical protein
MGFRGTCLWKGYVGFSRPTRWILFDALPLLGWLSVFPFLVPDCEVDWCISPKQGREFLCSRRAAAHASRQLPLAAPPCFVSALLFYIESNVGVFPSGSNLSLLFAHPFFALSLQATCLTAPHQHTHITTSNQTSIKPTGCSLGSSNGLTRLSLFALAPADCMGLRPVAGDAEQRSETRHGGPTP